MAGLCFSCSCCSGMDECGLGLYLSPSLMLLLGCLGTTILEMKTAIWLYGVANVSAAVGDWSSASADVEESFDSSDMEDRDVCRDSRFGSVALGLILGLSFSVFDCL